MNSDLTLRSFGENALVFGISIVSSILAGLVVASFNIPVVLGVCGVLVCAGLASQRSALFWFVLFSGLVLIGVAQMYLPGSKYIKYIPPLGAAAMALHLVPALLERAKLPLTPATVAFLAFLTLSVVSLALNWSSIGAAIIGIKAYYPMWVIFIALGILKWKSQTIDAIPKVLLAVALIQLPFVLHQFLVLVPMRQQFAQEGMVAVDIVAGTFGGSIAGGGANAVLSLFLVTVVACIFSLWRERIIGTLLAAVGAVVLLTPTFLNSSKTVVLYIPIVFLVIASSDVARRPLRFLLGGLCVGAVAFGLLTSYVMLAQNPKVDSWSDLVRITYENQLSEETGRPEGYGGLTRWTVLTFWADKHRARDWMQIAIGHGPGATRVRESDIDLAETMAETTFGGRKIGYTAVAALLWEVGVLGLAAIAALFATSFIAAKRLYGYYKDRDRTRAAICNGISGAIVMLGISLFHKDFLVFHIPYQTLLVCLLGYVAALSNMAFGKVDDRAD